jgi:hypothetical protein
MRYALLTCTDESAASAPGRPGETLSARCPVAVLALE